MAQQSEKFEAIVKHLQKLNESENTVKQKLTAVSKVSMPAIQVQPKMTPEVDGVSSVIESPGVKDKSEEYLKKSEEWLKGIDKTLKNIQGSFAKNNSTSSKSDDVSGKSEGTGKLPGLPKEYTLTEGLKSTVGMAKSIGKGIAGFASNPKESLSNTFGSVKDTVKGALGTAKDILGAEAGYTPERERFAKGYAASAKGTQFQKGGKSALDAGKDKYDALKSKEDEINAIKEKMDIPASQGFSPLKKDQKELDKLNKEFTELDPRVAAVSPKTDVDKSPNEKITAASVNPESDNIETSGELITKEVRETNDLIGQNLSIVKEQLEELKGIRLALTPVAPDDPNKDPNKRTVEKLDELIEAVKEIDVGGGGSSLTDLIPGGGKAAAGGKLASKMAGFGKAAKIGGAALAIGAGAYTAYKGYTDAEDNKQAKLKEVQAKVDAGEMKPEEAAAARKEIGNTATVEKSGAVGEGTGLAAGAIAGGMAGAKLGATIGTFVGGPIGTAVGAGIGGLAGGALGAFAGSSAGKYVGEKAGEGINYLSEKAGSIGSKVSGWFGGSSSQAPTTGKVSAAAMGATTAPVVSTQQKSESYTKIAGERVVPDQPLSDKQMAVIEMSKGMGNKYSPEVEAQYAKQKQTAAIEPKSIGTTVGPEVAKASTENADLNRDTSRGSTNVTPVVSTNISTNNNTSYVPVKPTPRNERGGSALDRYHDRVSAF